MTRGYVAEAKTRNAEAAPGHFASLTESEGRRLIAIRISYLVRITFQRIGG
jgi:hypothetical protein